MRAVDVDPALSCLLFFLLLVAPLPTIVTVVIIGLFLFLLDSL